MAGTEAEELERIGNILDQHLKDIADYAKDTRDILNDIKDDIDKIEDKIDNITVNVEQQDVSNAIIQTGGRQPQSEPDHLRRDATSATRQSKSPRIPDKR